MKDTKFYDSLNSINNAKIKAINFQNLNIISRELVNLANSHLSNSISFIDGNISDFL